MDKIIIVILLLFNSISFSQRSLNLNEVIELAQEKSVGAKIVRTTYSNRYWAYKLYKSNYMPQLSLWGKLPDLDRGLSSITQDDGSQAFINRSFLSSAAALSLSQNIGFTGSQISLNSNVNRIDILQNGTSSSYLYSPIAVSINQPLLGFNSMKWEREIEPVRFTKAQKTLNAEMELLALNTSSMFFNVLIADVQTELAMSNVAMNDTLLKITKGRYNLGKIAENELLQMELNSIQSETSYEQAKLDRSIAIARLKSHLGIKPEEEIILNIPDFIPEFSPVLETALLQAKSNHPDQEQMKESMLNVDRGLARAKRENSFQVDLFASYGLSTSADGVEVFTNQADESQRFYVTAQIPILDWGRSKANVNIAEANKELVELQVQQDMESFDQNIMLAVSRFAIKRTQLKSAIMGDEIAQKQYFVAVQRFKIGKIGIIDLNLAMDSQTRSKTSYLNSLKSFWNSYYDLRVKTLYDFEKQEVIDYHLSN